MRTRIAGGLSVSHLRSETDLKSHNKKNAFLKMREAFSYFQNFAFEAAIQADKQARATSA